MKKKRILSMALLIALLLTALPVGAPALAAKAPTPWAVPEVNEANTTGLVTPSAAKDFHSPLTRGEFCEIVVEMIERVLGRPLAVPAVNPFTDDIYPIGIHILKASHYGIINGYTPTRFSPELNLERQQLCVLMINAVRKLERDLNRTLLNPGIATLPYKDSNKIYEYAVESAKLAYTNDIMHGDPDGYFMPVSTVVSEECVIAALRCFNRIEAVRTAGMSTSQLLDAAVQRIRIGYAYGDSEFGVTRNVLLPVRSVGGSTVTWTSSNNNIISISGETGLVSTGSSPRSVTLTATIRLGNSTRSKEFTLMTSTYTDDRLMLENALSALDIYYVNDGDYADFVTGRIWLPVNVLSLPVTWTSSNPSVISSTGAVSVPSGSDTRTVTMTASVRSGAQTRTKTFVLTVVNPAFGPGVTLHGVWPGMSQTQVTQLLGTARRAITASSTEIWQLYRSNNYTNFIAVAFINNRVAAVYSMASGVANQLRSNAGTVITVAQANAYAGITAVSYNDPGNSSQQYAILICDSSSVIGKQRSLIDEGQEQLLFELTNAFRVRNSRSVLEWTERLGTPARTHSSNTGSGNLRQRVTSYGFDSALYAGGNIVPGASDAVEAFHQIVSSSTGSSAMRTEILQNSVTMFGSGYSGGHSGTYRTYYTYTLGAVTPITGVTATQQGVNGNVTTVNVGIGASATTAVTLRISPTGFNETFAVTSSNTAIMTVSSVVYTTTGATLAVTGVAGGSASIVITGRSSGKSYSIPVTVSMVYANNVVVSWSGQTLPNTTNTNNNTGLLMANGSTVELTATPRSSNGSTITGATVLWASSNTGIVRVNSSGFVTAHGNGTALITATVQRSSSANDTYTYSVPVTVVTVTWTGNWPSDRQDLARGATLQLGTASVNAPTGVTTSQAWSPTTGNIATVNSSGLVTAGTGTGEVRITLAINSTGRISTISRSVLVNATGVAAYATDMTLSVTDAVMSLGTTAPTVTIIATLTPTQVTNNTITWTSDADKVATVDGNGVVTGLSPGYAMITATISTSESTTLSKNIIVSVRPTIHLSGPSTLEVGQFEKLAPTVYPFGYPVEWSSSDESVATVDGNGVVLGISEGTVEITATVAPDTAFEASDTVTIIIITPELIPIT